MYIDYVFENDDVINTIEVEYEKAEAVVAQLESNPKIDVVITRKSKKDIMKERRKTIDVFESMPKAVQAKLMEYKKMQMRGGDSVQDAMIREEGRHRAGAYTQALHDAGLISDAERMKLFIYTTV